MADPCERMEQMIRKLKEKGHRLTPQRIAVLRVLSESKRHPSVEQIYEQVKRDFPTTTLATIYKNVSLLKAMGQILELGFAGDGRRYDGNKPYPHPHAICINCGKIVDPEYESKDTLSQDIARRTGYQITNHRLDFFGLCPSCQEKS